MTICYFGTYDPEYNRNKVIIEGLKANGIEVVECNTRATGFRKYWELVKKHREIKNRYDAMIVGFPGQQAMILARFLTKKKIFFDVFTSLFDSVVFDRKTVRRWSPRSYYYFNLDWLSCQLADKILLDTDEHIKFFVKTFGIPKTKFIRVWVGSTMKPLPRAWRQDEDFIVTFYGTDIPLQGVDYIIRAAALVKDPDISFRIIGTNIKKRYQGHQDKKITFLDNLSYPDLAQEMANADIVLGVFGDSDRAKRVIPHKVFDAICTGKAVITADTPAARELFQDKKHILFCQPAAPADLAEKIILLKKDSRLREEMERNNLALAKSLRPESIVKSVIEKI